MIENDKLNNSIRFLKVLHDKGFLCSKTDRYPHIKYKCGRYRLYVPYIYGESYLTYDIKDNDIENFNISVKMIEESMKQCYDKNKKDF